MQRLVRCFKRKIICRSEQANPHPLLPKKQNRVKICLFRSRFDLQVTGLPKYHLRPWAVSRPWSSKMAQFSLCGVSAKPKNSGVM